MEKLDLKKELKEVCNEWQELFDLANLKKEAITRVSKHYVLVKRIKRKKNII